MVCNRCKLKDALEGKSRCKECLEYARNWQKIKTKERREAKLCITCRAPTDGLSRCVKCTEDKSRAYFSKKGTFVNSELLSA